MPWCIAGLREGIQTEEFCHRGNKKHGTDISIEGLRKPGITSKAGWWKLFLSQSQSLKTERGDCSCKGQDSNASLQRS